MTAANPPAPTRFATLLLSLAGNEWRPMLIYASLIFIETLVIAVNHGNLPGLLAESAALVLGFVTPRFPRLWVVPVAAALALLFDDGLSSSDSFFVVIPALIDLMATGHTRLGWSLTAAIHGTLLIAVVMPQGPPATTYLPLSFFTLCAACSGAWVHTKSELAQAQRLAFHTARQDERIALARDIHDTVAAQLSHIVLLSRNLNAELPHHLRTRSQLIHDEALLGLNELRRLIGALREDDDDHDVTTDDTGSLEATWHESLAVLAANSFPVDHDLQVKQQPPDDAVAALGSISLREVVGNVIRHCPQGALVRLQLSVDQQGIRIASSNPTAQASGHSNTDAVQLPRSGFGLAGLRERLEPMGGKLSHTTVDGHWIISICLPLRPEGATA